MISNLPLLFADGYPTCLDKITVGQLEKFVPFMVQCSYGNNTVSSSVPEWWPDNLEFSLPVIKPQGMDSKWPAILKSLVCRCYSYHGCDFMLQFSEALSQCAVSSLRFVDGRDGTTSLYSKVTGKLLVTFRNENMLYDKKRESPKKTLLSRRYDEPEQSHIMVQPPLFDIYLCENCDGEFSSLKEMQYHEKICHLEQHTSTPSVVSEDLNSDQDKFLSYFYLSNASNGAELKSPRKTQQSNFKKTVGGSWRYAGIPFSSPLGLLVHRKIQVSHSTKIERNCPAKPSDLNAQFCRRRSPSWIVSWKPPEKNEEIDNAWVHIYKYPKWKSWKNTVSIGNQLIRKNLQLHGQCRNVHVKLKRLTQQEIDLYTSPIRANVPSTINCLSSVSSQVNHNSNDDCRFNQLLPRDLIVTESNGTHEKFYPVETELTENSVYSYNALKMHNPHLQLDLYKETCDGDQTSAEVMDHYKSRDVNNVDSQKHPWTNEVEAIPVISLISSDEESEDI